ncbi:unnamed protein product [Penicillium nalgiovense]|nr:unnamed protein product [Penicillium nalgiovense]
MKVLNLNGSLATPALKLLDLYFCLWECYVVKSSQKIRLEEEQRQLQASNDLLASDSEILLQLCNVQASVLWERKRTVQALCNGVVSALEASDLQAYSAEEPEAFHLSQPTLNRCCKHLHILPTAFDGQSNSRNERIEQQWSVPVAFIISCANITDYDLDLDLHAIWHESSGIPTPPPCLATDPNDLWQDSFGKDDPAEYETQEPSLIECLFYPNLDSLSGFKWTGPDPLTNSTRASDIFLHMSALLFPKEVHWIEFRFVRFDRISGETIGEDLFFLPRAETAMGNLYRIRRQLLDTITWHAVRATGTSFRLSLWPRTESLPYSSLSTHSLLTRLPLTLSLDSQFFVHNISSNYE